MSSIEAELASMVSALVYDSRSDDDAQQLAPCGRAPTAGSSGTRAFATLERAPRREGLRRCDLTPSLTPV